MMRGAIDGRSSSVSWQQRTSCRFSTPHFQLLPSLPRQHSLMLATTQTHQSLSTRFDELEVELQVHPGQDTSRHIVTCLFFSKHGQQIRAERVRQAFLHVADACRREEDAGTT